MPLLRNAAQWFLFIGGWLLLLMLPLAVAGVVWRRRRAGKVAALLAGLLLLALAAAFAAGDVSWRLFPALARGYHYDPNVAAPDSKLVSRRPDLIVERQLTALVGQTGPAPLHPDSPLVDFTVDMVHIDWHNRQWLTAVTNVTLIFANDEQTQVALRLPAKGGSYLLIPFLGEVNRNAYAWYPPESSLGSLLQTPAPVTALRSDAPPVTLRPAGSVDVAALDLEHVNPEASFAAASDVSANGALLLDVDLRRGQTSVGNALLRHVEGETEALVGTWLSARAAFSPSGKRIAYIRSRENRSLQLIVREAGGAEREITAVDWMTHHWVGDGRIAYSQDSVAYLHDLDSGERRALATLPPQDFIVGRLFRVSPDGQRIAYADFDGRLWVKEVDSNQRHAIGWDVTTIGWNAGLVWRNDGRQLLLITRNITTLPNQAELWLWDAASDSTRLLVRTGPGFLGGGAEASAQLWQSCWVDEETVLLVANISGYRDDVHVLAAQTDGGGVWDVTPDDKPAFPYSHCDHGRVAVNTSRTKIDLYQIVR